MDRIPLVGGSYATRSVLGSAIKCINYYAETNAKDAGSTPMTFYQRPGLVPLVQGPPTTVRCLYQASTGIGYTVIGDTVFKIGPDNFQLKALGLITAGRTNPVSMNDDGQVIMIVDGGPIGWQVMMQDTSFSVVGNVGSNNLLTDISVVGKTIGTGGVAVGMGIAASGVGPGIGVAAVVDGKTVRMTGNGGALTAAFTGAIVAGTPCVLTASAVTGQILPGMKLFDFSGAIAADTVVVSQLTGPGGGAGTYVVTPSQTVIAEPMTATTEGQVTITFSASEDFFAPISDPTGIFQGADRAEYIDTFRVWNMPGTSSFGSTLSGFPISFDGTYFAAKTVYPDRIQTLVVNRHEIVLLGLLKSELWYNAGNATFPFAILPGSYIEHGCVAKYSVATSDINVFWLGSDLQGRGIVFRQKGYWTTRISNHAVEYAMRQMPQIADAIGYTYQQDGHVFYVLHFPAGDQTWVFDDSIAEPTLAWHQEGWTDPATGTLHRHRGNCCAALYGKIVVGDYANGTLYSLDLNTYNDAVGGAVQPIVCTRTFPMVTRARSRNGQVVEANGGRVQFTKFWADLECGTVPYDIEGNPAQIVLRYSDDRGKTFSEDVLQSAGQFGEFVTQPQWGGLGIGRYRLFELSHSIAGPAALNGGYFEGNVLDD